MISGKTTPERVAAPGHGPPSRDGARQAATGARGKRRRLEQVRELVDAQDLTVVDITARLFCGELTGAQRHFAMAEILADLAFHEVRGILERFRRPDGVFVWRRTGAPEQREVAR